MTPEVEAALAWADGTCGHHPQFDCDKHHPNPVLARALRESEAAKESYRTMWVEVSKTLDEVVRPRAEKAEESLAAVEREMHKMMATYESQVAGLAAERDEARASLAALKEGEHRNCVHRHELAAALSTIEGMRGWKELALESWAQFARTSRADGKEEYDNGCLSVLESLEDALHREGLIDAKGFPLWENLAAKPGQEKP